jgi:hypothetical protein
MTHHSTVALPGNPDMSQYFKGKVSVQRTSAYHHKILLERYIQIWSTCIFLMNSL